MAQLLVTTKQSIKQTNKKQKLKDLIQCAPEVSKTQKKTMLIILMMSIMKVEINGFRNSITVKKKIR